MTKSIQIRTIAITTAFAAMTGLALFAQTGSASAKNVLSCEGPDRRSVRECCESLVQRKGLPMWMKQTGRNCVTGVTIRCVKSKPTYPTFSAPPVIKCWTVVVAADEGGNGQRGGRGKGNRGNGGRGHGGQTAGKK